MSDSGLLPWVLAAIPALASALVVIARLLLAAVQRGYEAQIAAIQTGHARELAALERIIADVTRDRDNLMGYTGRSLDLADKSADLATRRSLLRPPLNPTGGGHD